jgi:hypothetical protein
MGERLGFFDIENGAIVAAHSVGEFWVLWDKDDGACAMYFL